MKKLKYGNTNTFFIESGGLLFDTDYAGTLPAFYRALKQNGIRTADIRYVMASHFHPDHMGLIGELTAQGVRLLLMDVQKDHIRFSDRIFERERIPFKSLDADAAKVISCEESRAFLAGIGIRGEIISTPSHSEDSVTLMLDDGSCFAGDLEPIEYLEAYDGNEVLQRDWERILSKGAVTVYFAHRPEKRFGQSYPV